MLTQLSPDQYPAILPLFAPLDFNLVIRSVIAGNTPAWVFADDPSQPRLALIWDMQDALLMAGDPSFEAAHASAAETIVYVWSEARRRHIPGGALFYTPGWETRLPQLLPLSLQPAQRHSFRLRNPDQAPSAFSFLKPLPEAFELRRIDSTLLASQLINLNQVCGWINSFWATPQDFLERGIGYCAIHEETIAAWCLTVFAADQERELGLATMPEFRGRGLAGQVAAACIQYLLAHHQAPHWHCWADNLPSAAVARRLGFRLERDYTVFRFSLA